VKLAVGNAQVMLTTHSPYFVSGEHFESVRMVRRNPTTKRTGVRRPKLTDVAAKYATATAATYIKPVGAMAKIHQALQPGLNEMFFTQRLILVEGLEDLAYLMSWLSLLDRMEEFRRLGCHIVPVHGKSELLRPLIIAQGLEIPVYVLFDADGDKIEKAERKKDHERDNLGLLKLLGADEAQVFPSSVYHGANWTIFPSDFGAIVDADIVEALGKEGFSKIKNESLMAFENEKGLGKNYMQIGVKLAKTFEAGCNPSSLEDICGRLLSF
jgi:putative ATP-dependent endonuclease of the OLD family